MALASLADVFQRHLGARLGVLDERVEVLPHDLGPFHQGHVRADGAVGPDFQNQLVVVGPLADAGFLDVVLDADHRGEAGVDRDDADLPFLARVFVGRAVAPAILDGHLDDERHIIGHGGDDVLGVDDLHRFVGDDVGGRDDAFFVPVDLDGLGQFAGVLDHQALDVEDDVGDILDDAGNGGDFVLHPLDLDTSDGTPFQAGDEDAPQTVADGHAEAAFERLGMELAIGIGQGLAFAGQPVGQFQPTPFDTHRDGPP